MEPMWTITTSEGSHTYLTNGEYFTEAFPFIDIDGNLL